MIHKLTSIHSNREEKFYLYYKLICQEKYNHLHCLSNKAYTQVLVYVIHRKISRIN